MYNQLLDSAFETTIEIIQNVTEDELKILVRQEANCSKALQDWLTCKIDEETFLDILEANGHTMDISLKIFDENLDYLGV